MEKRRKGLRRVEVAGCARYLTFSCYRRRELLGSEDARDAFADQLMLTRARIAFGLLAWVVMPEHVHLLVRPDGGVSVASLLMALKRPVSRRLIEAWAADGDARLDMVTREDGSRRFWQAGGGYDRVVLDGAELPEKIRYIHENPVRRGLAGRAEDWAWSSARAWAGVESRWGSVDRW